jgi:hypothetical protein
MLVYVVGTVHFLSTWQRSLHFAKHGHEFGALNEFDYEIMAETFMSAIMRPNMRECCRTTGTHDRCRIDGTTRQFGIAYDVLTIRTYYVVTASKIRRYRSAVGYVQAQCAKTG